MTKVASWEGSNDRQEGVGGMKRHLENFIALILLPILQQFNLFWRVCTPSADPPILTELKGESIFSIPAILLIHPLSCN